MNKLTLLTATVAVGALLAGCGDMFRSDSRSSANRSMNTTSTAQAADPQVRQVQQALNQAGFHAGEVDGVWGGQTEQALRNYQRARGLDVTGQMDSRTLASLGVAGPNTQTGSAVGSATTTSGTAGGTTSGTTMSGTATGTSPATGVSAGSGTTGGAASSSQLAVNDSGRVREVQQALSRAGFYSGEVDGVWNARTQDALRNFQRQRGLDQTGQMDSRTLAALNVGAGASSPTGQAAAPATTAPASSTSGTGMSGATTPGTAGTGSTVGNRSSSPTGAGTSATPPSAYSATPGTAAVRQNEQQQRQLYRERGGMTDKQAHRGAMAGTHPTREQVREVQMSLERAGHDVGEVDGIWGPRTQRALRDFQQARGLEATGRLDGQTRQALGVRS